MQGEIRLQPTFTFAASLSVFERKKGKISSRSYQQFLTASKAQSSKRSFVVVLVVFVFGVVVIVVVVGGESF